MYFDYANVFAVPRCTYVYLVVLGRTEKHHFNNDFRRFIGHLQNLYITLYYTRVGERFISRLFGDCKIFQHIFTRVLFLNTKYLIVSECRIHFGEYITSLRTIRVLIYKTHFVTSVYILNKNKNCLRGIKNKLNNCSCRFFFFFIFLPRRCFELKTIAWLIELTSNILT